MQHLQHGRRETGDRGRETEDLRQETRDGRQEKENRETGDER